MVMDEAGPYIIQDIGSGSGYQTYTIDEALNENAQDFMTC